MLVALSNVIDLRSDTVTRPTPAMRAAMAAAEVGDDVYGEDPTVNRLEARAAEIFGREAAIFVPTGTMGNQIAIRLHTQHGQEVICEARSHILDWEMAMMSAFSGCLPRTIAGDRGILTWSQIASRHRAKDLLPRSRPVSLASKTRTTWPAAPLRRSQSTKRSGREPRTPGCPPISTEPASSTPQCASASASPNSHAASTP